MTSNLYMLQETLNIDQNKKNNYTIYLGDKSFNLVSS